MLALLRNEGGSVGTSLAQTITERREQFHTLRLNEHLDPFHPALESARQQGQQFFMQHTGDPATSQHMTLQVIANLRDRQALSLAYFDVFWFCAVVPLALIALVFLMRRSVAEKGAPPAGSDGPSGLTGASKKHQISLRPRGKNFSRIMYREKGVFLSGTRLETTQESLRKGLERV